MRKSLIALGILLELTAPVSAQVSFGFGFQTDNVSISLSTYPNLVRVPGYPVYYATGLNSNYFFYDGLYWIFESDRWYSSAWYNGPWTEVDPEFIPLYLLRVPVRYYRRPPSFFMGWQANSPPRWDDHWGNQWSQQRHGWDQWNHRAMPAPAPLPSYQRKYSGERYPPPDRQQALQRQNYRHEARDPMARDQSPITPSIEKQRGRFEPPQRPNMEQQVAPQRPTSSFKKETPEAPQAPRPQWNRGNQEPQRQQATPRAEEHPVPGGNMQPRETNMRPPPEAKQPALPSNDDRAGSRPADSGQRPGQQREHDNFDERGQGRGR